MKIIITKQEIQASQQYMDAVTDLVSVFEPIDKIKLLILGKGIIYTDNTTQITAYRDGSISIHFHEDFTCDVLNAYSNLLYTAIEVAPAVKSVLSLIKSSMNIHVNDFNIIANKQYFTEEE